MIKLGIKSRFLTAIGGLFVLVACWGSLLYANDYNDPYGAEPGGTLWYKENAGAIAQGEFSQLPTPSPTAAAYIPDLAGFTQDYNLAKGSNLSLNNSINNLFESPLDNVPLNDPYGAEPGGTLWYQENNSAIANGDFSQLPIIDYGASGIKPEPFYFPISRIEDREVDAFAQTHQVPAARVKSEVSRLMGAFGPEFDNVMMGQGMSWNEIADFVEQGVKDGSVNITKRPISEEFARRNPEEQFGYLRSLAENKFGLIKPYTYEQTDLQNGKKAHVFYADSFREQPYFYIAFSDPLLSTIVIDTKKSADYVDFSQVFIKEVEKILAEDGVVFNGLGIKNAKKTELFAESIRDSFIHEKEHLWQNDQIANWLEKGVPVNLMYYYINLPPKEQLFITTHEIAAISKTMGASAYPQFSLIGSDYLTTRKMKEINASDTPGAISSQGREHMFAGRSIAPRVMHDLGFGDYAADRYIAAQKLQPDYKLTATEEKQLRAKVKEKEFVFYDPDYLKLRLEFADQLKNPGEINKMVNQHHDALFGPSFSTQGITTPRAVVDDYKFYHRDN